MEYLDEKILPLIMRQKEQQVHMSLEDGYYINGKLEKFVKTELFDKKISLFLPESFVDMPEQISDLKYPSSFRPQIIKTNLECSVNFLFNILENPHGLDHMAVANSFQMILEKTNPALKIHESATEKIAGKIEAVCFDFTNFGVDEQIYNYMCFIKTGGSIIQAVFNCPVPHRFQWIPIAKEVFLAMEIDLKEF